MKRLILVLLVFTFFVSCKIFAPDYDILIKGGRVVDGSGKPGYSADVGIRNGKIVDIGNLQSKSARQTIDAHGQVVAPGFIDLHTHAERRILDFPDVHNYIRQGVTTVVGGNCGGSPWPTGEFLQKVKQKGIALNLALLVGHNTVRRQVMGTEDREPSPDELEQMKAMVEQAMREGAVGLSTGLKYVPGAYAKIDEVIELAKAVAKYGGFYATHMRDEGLKLLDSVEEALEIGRRAGVPVHISHHKAVGRSMWGKSALTLAKIDEAVRAGLDVTLDQYPYTATSTGLTVVFPAWSLAGGQEPLLARLKDPEQRRKIKEAIVYNIIYDRGGGDPASIVVSSFPPDTTLEGKNLAEITRLRGRKPTPENAAETLMELQEMGGGRGIYHCLAEEDVKRIMQHPLTAVASDGVTIEYSKAKPHPRSYGTFPRVLGKYVREEKVLTLEEAIRKMTSLPAQRLKLKDRGRLQPGAWADVVVFDPETVHDTATWTEPHQYPVGISFVLVNGQIVVDETGFTGNYPGRVVYGPGYMDEKK
ncbi:MAG: D-aminoacylase [candidate division KSB1 bacterium]|nr:D-aminoacylase [candidate division KSB1 bacterium]